MTKAAIWARVSTHDQETGNQMLRLREWAEHRGLEVVETYELEESAWNGAQRRELDKALTDARVGHYQVLLVWSLDRLTREGVEATLALMRRFRDAGAMVWSLQESWTETSDPRMAELLTSIFAWISAEESRKRSERVKLANARRKAQGLPVGRQPGAKDKAPRRRSGYVKRWEDQRGR